MTSGLSELRVALAPPFEWLRVAARYTWTCPRCGAENTDQLPVLADWLDRRAAIAQAAIADGLTCPRCEALVPPDVPLVQLRGADAVRVLVGLPARAAGADDEAAIRDVLAVAGSVRQLDDHGAVVAVRMAWWSSLWNRPLGPRLTGRLPLVLPESDEEVERWRLATIEASGFSDPGDALNRFMSAGAEEEALSVLAAHGELTDPRWRLTVDLAVAALREAQPTPEAAEVVDSRAGLLARARLVGSAQAGDKMVPEVASLVDTALTAGHARVRERALESLREAAARGDLDPGLAVAVRLAWLEARHGAHDRRVLDDDVLLSEARALSGFAADALGADHELALHADLNLAVFIEELAEGKEGLAAAESLLADLGRRAAVVGSSVVADAATNLATVVARWPGSRADNPLDAADYLADADHIRALLRRDPDRDPIVALIDQAATLRARVSGSLRENAEQAVALIRTAIDHERWSKLSASDQALTLSNLSNALHQLHERAPDAVDARQVREAASDALAAAEQLDPQNAVSMRVRASAGATLIHLYAESVARGLPADEGLWRDGTDALEAAFAATRDVYPPHHRSVLVAALNLASAHGCAIEGRVANSERCLELLQYVIDEAPPAEAEAQMKAAMNLGQLHIGRGAWQEAADAFEIAAGAHARLFAGARLFSTRLGEIVDSGDLAVRRALALVGAERYREAVGVLEASRARLRSAASLADVPHAQPRPARRARAIVHVATCAYGTLGLVALPDGRFAPFTSVLDTRRLKPLIDGLVHAAAALERQAAFDALAEAIGPAVVAPVQRALEAATHPLDEVAIVSCGTLASCPVTRVPGPDGRALVDQYPVREIVSLRSLRDGPAPSPGRAVAIIDPDGDLPFARAEREALAGWTEGVVEPPGDRPVRPWLLGELADASVAHLACHGRFDPEDPMRSTFRLGGEEALTVADLVERELPRLELVVAPACQSGTGGPDAPDELLGVAHMLAHAGARHVIASLWDADDAATALVVARLYKALADGEAPHAALQSAQRWVAAATGPALAALGRSRLAGDRDAAWLPYDLAIEFVALGAHPIHRTGEEPVFGHPALWGALSCLDA